MKFVRGWAYPDDDHFMSSHMPASGEYQGSHFHGAMAHVKRRKVAVDGGAHVGTWSKMLSERFEQVISFEPSADTHEALLHNLAQFGCGNVTVRHQALGAARGRVRMTLEGFDKAIQMGNTGARFVRPGDDVEQITLDSLQLETLDFLKLDVEGSELYAMQGARGTLVRCKPIVLFEDKNLWKRYNLPRSAPHDFLSSLGARRIERIGCDEIWGWA